MEAEEKSVHACRLAISLAYSSGKEEGILLVPAFPLFIRGRVTLQRHNTENSKKISPEKELWGLSTNFHIHAPVSDLYIPMIGLPILL
jgi:hypothetical protein